MNFRLSEEVENWTTIWTITHCCRVEGERGGDCSMVFLRIEAQSTYFHLSLFSPLSVNFTGVRRYYSTDWCGRLFLPASFFVLFAFILFRAFNSHPLPQSTRSQIKDVNRVWIAYSGRFGGIAHVRCHAVLINKE